MSVSLSDWMGKSVVLHVFNSGLHVPLRCKLLGESDGKLRIRIADSWDVDIFKDMVIGLDPDSQSLWEETSMADVTFHRPVHC